MNRRKFFSLLGLGAIASIIPATLAYRKDNLFKHHIQKVNISMNFVKELHLLGHKKPYYRVVDFPREMGVV